MFWLFIRALTPLRFCQATWVGHWYNITSWGKHVCDNLSIPINRVNKTDLRHLLPNAVQVIYFGIVIRVWLSFLSPQQTGLFYSVHTYKLIWKKLKDIFNWVDMGSFSICGSTRSRPMREDVTYISLIGQELVKHWIKYGALGVVSI